MMTARRTAYLISYLLFLAGAFLLGHFASELLGVLLFLAVSTTIVLVWIDSRHKSIASQLAASVAACKQSHWNASRAVSAELHALDVLSRRFPHILMPVTTFSMKPTNLLALLTVIEEVRPQLVVEFGCGVSTMLAAATVRELGSGRLCSFENDVKWARRCSDYLRRDGLDSVATVLHVPLVHRHSLGQDVHWYDVEPYLADLHPVDLLVVDGPYGAGDGNWARLPAVDVFHSHLSANAVIFLDDGIRRNERRIVDRWVKCFPDLHARYCHGVTGYWLVERQPSLEGPQSDPEGAYPLHERLLPQQV